jgi:hypothetical protein
VKVSWDDMTFPYMKWIEMENKKYVWNHQPVLDEKQMGYEKQMGCKKIMLI